MTADECRELAVLWQRYGVTYDAYVTRITAGQADVMLAALGDEQTASVPGVSAFAQAPGLDL